MSNQQFVAIGDIHGCNRSMEALLDKLTHYDDRTFVFVGDYIDRGPNSKGVIDYLLDFKKEYECIFLRGNHEQMLLDAYKHDETDLWLMNGGRTTLESYDSGFDNFELPEAHLDFYSSTKLYHNATDYFFVHAGLSPGQTIEDSIGDEKAQKDFLWGRAHLNAFETAWEKTVVFGHTPRPHPIQKEKMIGIDTGCVYESLGYGKLTSVLLPEVEFVQQTCID